MRELKAYLRRSMLEPVMRALHDAGVQRIVVGEVHSFGTGMDPQHWRLSMDAGGQYTEHIKLEIVCAEGDTDKLAALILAKARTGTPGDGIIFVSPVVRAIKIRTGVEGPEAIS